MAISTYDLRAHIIFDFLSGDQEALLSSSSPSYGDLSI